MDFLKKIAQSPSQSFFVFCVSFIFGITLAHFFPSKTNLSWLVFVCFLLGTFAFFIKNTTKRLFIIVFALILFGIFCFAQASFFPSSGTIQQGIGHSLRIQGTVKKEVSKRISSQEVILKDVLLADQPVLGNLQLWLPLYPDIFYADILTFQCQLKKPEPFNGFAYDKYLASQNIYATCSFPEHLQIHPPLKKTFLRFLFEQKRFFLYQIDNLFPEPHSAFISGLLFGGSVSLSKELQESFSQTGLSHILAASGYNIAIFSFVLLHWLQRSFLGKRKALFLVAGFLVVYVFMAGATASIVRAGIMGFLSLLSIGFARPVHLRNILFFTAALMLFHNPRLLFADVGFQLSFLATAGLLLFSQKLEHKFWFLPKRFGIQEAVVSSFSAMFFTLPVILWHFGSISILSPLANFLVLPFIPFLMFFGFLATCVYTFFPALAVLFSLPAWAFSQLVLHSIFFLSSLSFVSVSLPFSRVLAIFSLVIVIGIFFLISHHKNSQHQKKEQKQKKNQNFFRVNIQSVGIKKQTVFSCGLFCVLFLMAFFLHASEGQLFKRGQGDWRVWFFDVGQGDAVFIQTPEGKQFLLDSGRDKTVLSKLGSVMLPWDHRLDGIILTHPDADHMTGFIEILRRYQVETVYETGVQTDKELQKIFREQGKRSGAKFIFVSDKDSLEADGCSLKIIAPDQSLFGQEVEDTNRSSLAIYFVCSQKSFLFAGDMPIEGESEILPDITYSIDVLLLPHHGSVFSASPLFLKTISPTYGIISVGENVYGHPHPVLLQRLKNQQTRIFRTDQDGDVLARTIRGQLDVRPAPLPF